MLQPEPTYQLLRNLTSPVVAITAERNGKENGMISDAAVRASIVPTVAWIPAAAVVASVCVVALVAARLVARRALRGPAARRLTA